MLKSIVIAVAVFAPFVVAGLAADAGEPDQSAHALSHFADAHYRHYEAIRPYLMSGQDSVAETCDDGWIGVAREVAQAR